MLSFKLYYTMYFLIIIVQQKRKYFFYYDLQDCSVIPPGRNKETKGNKNNGQCFKIRKRAYGWAVLRRSFLCIKCVRAILLVLYLLCLLIFINICHRNVSCLLFFWISIKRKQLCCALYWRYGNSFSFRWMIKQQNPFRFLNWF